MNRYFTTHPLVHVEHTSWGVLLCSIQRHEGTEGPINVLLTAFNLHVPQRSWIKVATSQDPNQISQAAMLLNLDNFLKSQPEISFHSLSLQNMYSASSTCLPSFALVPPRENSSQILLFVVPALHTSQIYSLGF